MLKMFAEESGDYFLKVDEGGAFDQRPFRSMLIRKYITYRPGSGFKITREGADAWREFLMTDIARKNPKMPLTSYFDPTAYTPKKSMRSAGRSGLRVVA